MLRYELHDRTGKSVLFCLVYLSLVLMPVSGRAAAEGTFEQILERVEALQEAMKAVCAKIEEQESVVSREETALDQRTARVRALAERLEALIEKPGSGSLRSVVRRLQIANKSVQSAEGQFAEKAEVLQLRRAEKEDLKQRILALTKKLQERLEEGDNSDFTGVERTKKVADALAERLDKLREIDGQSFQFTFMSAGSEVQGDFSNVTDALDMQMDEVDQFISGIEYGIFRGDSQDLAGGYVDFEEDLRQDGHDTGLTVKIELGIGASSPRNKSNFQAAFSVDRKTVGYQGGLGVFASIPFDRYSSVRLMIGGEAFGGEFDNNQIVTPPANPNLRIGGDTSFYGVVGRLGPEIELFDDVWLRLFAEAGIAQFDFEATFGGGVILKRPTINLRHIQQL